MEFKNMYRDKLIKDITENNNEEEMRVEWWVENRLENGVGSFMGERGI